MQTASPTHLVDKPVLAGLTADAQDILASVNLVKQDTGCGKIEITFQNGELQNISVEVSRKPAA